MAAVPLFCILPAIKSNGLFGFFATGFDTTLLIGQYFSYGYFWAIVWWCLVLEELRVTDLEYIQNL